MATIKCQIRKVKLQLKQRKELGEALRAIDFEQLNIENQVCIRKIDEKYQHLLQMKKIAGGYSIALTKHKEKVDGLTSTMNGIPSVIDYIKLRIKLRELQRIHKQLSRQRGIQQITLKSRSQSQDVL
ncbi:coiled-coil domain-containing protein 113 [Solenopsis invicta]|uniref:coiled-coil domain-containing protein 113 n=1 Tax=Solenopsis invicta TaxID=13686 RepID=UPI00193EC064|nr:coiled-coil domain-containing protein 113 [Solenopsis invicta]